LKGAPGEVKVEVQVKGKRKRSRLRSRLRLRGGTVYTSFREMPVWKEAMSIAEEVFHSTAGLPRSEDYGLTSQLRRSALSISANLAEGYGRDHSKDKIHLYVIARGSANETQSHLEYAQRVGYIDVAVQEKLDGRLSALVHDINKIITTLKRSSGL
jgi:four helix bundle protein